MNDAPVRILMAKPGLDGHDRGAKVVSLALRDAGFHVIYLGRRKNPEQIVNAALQEDVGFIALSILSGSHIPLTEKIMKLLRENKATDIKVIVGGAIPDKDVEQLRRMGVEGVFPTGSDLGDIVKFVKETSGPKTAESVNP
ncbi:MAG: cobalamin B12-binding domain-containing protein [bacterium]